MTRRKREIIGLTNERDFQHLVELTFPPGGFRAVSRIETWTAADKYGGKDQQGINAATR